MVNNESGEKSKPAKFEATKFDSKNDGKVIEFTVSAYNINEKTLNMDITMDSDVYS